MSQCSHLLSSFFSHFCQLYSFCLLKANILLYHCNSLFCFSLRSILNIFNMCHPSFGCGFSSILLMISSNSSFLVGLLGKLSPDFYVKKICTFYIGRMAWVDNKILCSQIFYLSCSYFLSNEYCYGKSGATLFLFLVQSKSPFLSSVLILGCILILTILIQFALVPSVPSEYIDLSFILGKFS